MKAISVTFACVVAVGLDHIAAGNEVQKPNIIVIFTDDHGYADLSSQGVLEDIKTPHIDALAKGGARMESGYVTAPQCVPSRAGLMSGRYQNRFAVEHNGVPLDGFNAQKTIAERLKTAGYATGMTGKWHLGRADEIVDHGFDDVFYQGGTWTNFDIQGRDVQPGTKFDELYHLDAGSAAARAFIQRHHDQPFFLYVAYRAPHVPLDATKKYLDRFPGEMPERRRKALAMISAVDDGVGGIMESLRKYDLEQKTLIFFIGDNGAPLKIHKLDAPGGGPGWDGSLNDPMNGEKGMLCEGGIRVPFVVYWKGKIPAGQVYEHPVISLDVAATAVALSGLEPDAQLDGVNLVPYLSGEKQGAPHDVLFWRWIAQSAVREGNWKLLRGGKREYLFDLSTDKEEKRNLAAEHPEIAARLRGKLEAWSGELNPPGLAVREMSEVWQQYYDYYLDGKPAPKPQPHRAAARKVADGPRVQGLLARGGTLAVRDGVLQVRPAQSGAGAKAGRLFVVANGLNLQPPVTAKVRLRAETGGKVGIAWRERGQNDFAAGQVVQCTCVGSPAWQDLTMKIPADKPVIHIRLLLPGSGADVQSFEFQDAAQNVLKRWSFGPRKESDD